MKKNEVKVGHTYVAKVSDRLVPVRIDSVHSRQGWNATNTKTGRRVHIKSAQRLRREASGSKPKDAAAKAEVKDNATPPADGKAAKPKADKLAKPKRVSALDAAATVLRKAGKPMHSAEIIDVMAEQDLWKSPNGKTPHATLYAAILRELKAKGDAARFRKVARGQFEFAG